MWIEIDVNHQQPLANLSVQTSASMYEVGRNVTLTISVTAGSHTTYLVKFGNGVNLTLVPPDALAFLAPVKTTHAFSTRGLFTVTVNASNAEGSLLAQRVVKVVEAVQGLVLQATQLPLLSNSTFTYTVSLQQAGLVLENITCEFDYGDGVSFSAALANMTYGDSMQSTHSYYLGVFDVKATCTNGISSVTLKTSVVAEEAITGLTVQADRHDALVGDVFTFRVYTATGSNLVLTLALGDGQAETRSIGNNRRGASLVQFYGKYTQPGRYTVVISAYNLVSNATATLTSGTLHVVTLVQDLTLTAADFISYPPGVASVLVQHVPTSVPPSAAPTDVTCRLSSALLHNDHVYFVPQIGNGTSDGLQMDVNFTDTAIGVNTLLVNCSNVLSSQLLQTDVLLMALLHNVSLTVSSSFIMVKGKARVTWFGEWSKVRHT